MMSHRSCLCDKREVELMREDTLLAIGCRHPPLSRNPSINLQISYRITKYQPKWKLKDHWKSSGQHSHATDGPLWQCQFTVWEQILQLETQPHIKIQYLQLVITQTRKKILAANWSDKQNSWQWTRNHFSLVFDKSFSFLVWWKKNLWRKSNN